MLNDKFQIVPNSSKIYKCEVCNYSSVRKSQYERHLLTKKHNAKKCSDDANDKAHYICHCGKSYKHASSFSRHTRECIHYQELVTNGYKWVSNGLHVCECGKTYNHRQGLSRHRKKCILQQSAVIQQPISDEEFQNKLVNALKEVLPQMACTSVTNNVTHNNRITNNQINVFLNEKCADAMSIQQFAKQLKFSIGDVLLQKQDALVKVINKNLNPLKVTERPVHCTNVARRKWHVKDETEGWKNDDGSTLVRYVNNSLLRKCPAQYAATFPAWSNDPNRKDEYIQIVSMTSREMEPKSEARVLTNLASNTELNDSIMNIE